MQYMQVTLIMEVQRVEVNAKDLSKISLVIYYTKMTVSLTAT